MEFDIKLYDYLCMKIIEKILVYKILEIILFKCFLNLKIYIRLLVNELILGVYKLESDCIKRLVGFLLL